ncbi:hypothetical protein BV20DRAFT_329001 [Pilatotrama ljubarskyi]|nr:hypothetical protein BV20DRAFT_329001 [Pilatotrama ljubarskyi]
MHHAGRGATQGRYCTAFLRLLALANDTLSYVRLRRRTHSPPTPPRLASTRDRAPTSDGRTVIPKTFAHVAFACNHPPLASRQPRPAALTTGHLPDADRPRYVYGPLAVADVAASAPTLAPTKEMHRTGRTPSSTARI